MPSTDPKAHRPSRLPLRRRLLAWLVALVTALGLTGGIAVPAAVAADELHWVDIEGDTGCSLADAMLVMKSLGGSSFGTACGGVLIFGWHSLRLSGDVTLTEPLPEVDGYAVRIDGAGHTIARSESAAPFRLFEVSDGGELTISDAVLTGGSVAGADGAGGDDGTDGCGDDGEPCDGGWGDDGAAARGGAVWAEAATVTLERVVVTGNSVTGGDGGQGGDAGDEADGQQVLICYGVNPGGCLNDGGDGGAGGSGGAALGGGVYARVSTLTVVDSLFTDNTATGGDGGDGGEGGYGGDGTDGTDGFCHGIDEAEDGEPGSTAGDGGAGGAGGSPGRASGAAIYVSHGTTTVLRTSVVDQVATGGSGGAGAEGGDGGDGGEDGEDMTCLEPSSPIEPGLMAYGGAGGAAGQDGSDGADRGPGDALGAAVFFDGGTSDATSGNATDSSFDLTASTVTGTQARPGQAASGWGNFDGDVCTGLDGCLLDAQERDDGVGSAVAGMGHLRVNASTIAHNETRLSLSTGAFDDPWELDAGLQAAWLSDVNPTVDDYAYTWHDTAWTPNDWKRTVPVTVTSSILGPNYTVTLDGDRVLPGACRQILAQEDPPTLKPGHLPLASGGHNVSQVGELTGQGCQLDAGSDVRVVGGDDPVVSGAQELASGYTLPGDHQTVGALPTGEADTHGSLCADDYALDQRGATRPATGCSSGALEVNTANVFVLTSNLPDATFDTDYDETLEATGGDGSYTWALADGDLPLGLQLTSAGRVHGTPDVAGTTATFTVSVTDGSGATSTRELSIAVQRKEVDATVGGTAVYGASDEAIFSLALPGALKVDLATHPLTCTDVDGADIDDALAAGSYDLLASSCTGPTVDRSGSYDLRYVDGEFTVTTAELRVGASSPTVEYGEPVPTITPSYGGFVNGEDADVLTTEPTCTTTYAEGDLPGSYPSTCSGGAADNYTLHYLDGTVTVEAAPVEVTVTGQSTYGDAAGDVEFTAAHGTLPDGVDLTGAVSCTATTDGDAVDEQLPAGTHTIDGSTCSGLSSGSEGYVLDYTGGDLTVAPRPLTVTAEDQTATYGEPPTTWPVGYEGLVNGETGADVVSGLVCGALDTAGDPVSATTPVGTYPIVCESGSADNYALSYVDGTLTVEAATIPVAVTGTMTYGQDGADFGYAVDPPAGTSVTGDVVCTEVEGQPVGPDLPGGSYAIDGTSGCSGLTVGGPLAGNYVLGWSGTLDVAAAATAVVFDGTQTLPGDGMTASVTTGSPAAGCLVGETVEVTVDPDPAGGSDPWTTTLTTADGTAGEDVDASAWADGVYTVTSEVVATDSCLGSSDTAVLVVGEQGRQAGGSGWYELADLGRASFDVEVRSTRRPGEPSGEIVLEVEESWRLVGGVDTFARTGEVGSVSGTGVLLAWDADAPLGSPDRPEDRWQVVDESADYTVTLSAAVRGRDYSQPATFGIHLDLLPTTDGPPLPSSAPVELGAGNLSLR